MGIIRRLLEWLLSFFQKSETPDLDVKIKNSKERIKEIDKQLENRYDNVKDSMKEWK